MRDEPLREGSGEGPVETTASASPGPSPAPVPNRHEEEAVQADLAELLSSVSKERDEYLELARRTQADFENFRKRVARDSAAAEARGRADLAKALVPVVDNLERALSAAGGEEQSLAEGVRLVYEELTGALRRAGVESYEPAGESFDPEWHEAMMTRPGEAGRVLEVLEKGYRLDGQVLRPARVVVGSADDKNRPSAGKPSDGSA